VGKNEPDKQKRHNQCFKFVKYFCSVSDKKTIVSKQPRQKKIILKYTGMLLLFFN